jgi:hypothetical protein
LSHLTSCTPTKCNLYFANFLDIVFRETPDILSYKSHVHFPLLVSVQRIRPSLRPCVTFRSMLFFYGRELLAPRPTPKLVDQPLWAVRDFLFNIFAATVHIWRPFPPSVTKERAMQLQQVTR